jgi:tetratricopeptide (TPR) repeat protein
MQQEPNQKDLATVRLYRGIGLFYINTGDYKKAKPYLQQSYDQYIRDGMFRPDHAGYAQMCLAMLAYYQGDLQNAEQLFYGCVGLKPNAQDIMLPDKALDYRVGTGGADRVNAYIYLAKIEVHKGNIESATNYLSQGVSFYNHINTIPEERQYKKPIEADVAQAYGRLLFAQNKLLESRAAYEKAMRIRLATQGPLHPDYADALKGMADAFSAENKLTSATMCANKSLDVLDKALVSTHPRIAPTLIALTSIDAMTRHAEMTAPLKVRIETILQKPLGPWKEDFLETARFYAALLKKAGKGEEAEQLERLYVRQKDKR